jgi:hypothetical protein
MATATTAQAGRITPTTTTASPTPLVPVLGAVAISILII